MILLFLFALLPRIEIVSANDTSVTYRELMPLRVALDPTTRLFHYKGCRDVRPDMEWVSPAAALLRGYKEHACVSLRKDEYATQSETRAARDPAHFSVLFIGNSLTYFNEMPHMTSEIAAHESRPLRVEAVTQSGASLEDLWYRTDALKHIWKEHWDYVIFQERGGGEAHNRGELFHQYVRMFADQIRRSGAKPVLFMTWSLQHAAENEALYRNAAKRANIRLLPVGMAWDQRFDWDGVHPNVAGSYLIACMAYATIYDKPPLGLPFEFRHLANKDEFYDAALLQQTLNETQAREIQEAAWRAVQRAK